MQIITTKQKLAGVLHGIIVLFAYTSFLWLDWKLIVIGVLLYYIQLKIFDGCILTYAQFGKWNYSFTAHYAGKILRKFNVDIEDKKIKRFIDILAPIFLVLAIVLQVILKYRPLVVWKIW
ncbi:TPA: hypothetical protein DD449_01155 [Candidatus Berkelbacteria bacterium]|uniref:Uncharacterized protein n=1 Tax=Berkelbacteria bacterium GW2011_GWE1_39_12 TaxID=1618337 RepID=A0A0G4B5D6_9BACT|nr:MAG: hypothetical protein UT28_C0001G0856 [Berkelbacteria bacterium GW2011_GWE1_39_12]HBO60280.1 hypothetical protein [Candidatus Berkelbacteria bacterium]